MIGVTDIVLAAQNSLPFCAGAWSATAISFIAHRVFKVQENSYASLAIRGASLLTGAAVCYLILPHVTLTAFTLGKMAQIILVDLIALRTLEACIWLAIGREVVLPQVLLTTGVAMEIINTLAGPVARALCVTLQIDSQSSRFIPPAEQTIRELSQQIRELSQEPAPDPDPASA